MIHNIPLGNRAKTRISKEEYGERILAIENGENVESEDETDEEDDDITEEKGKNEKKQDEQTIMSEEFLGGDSFIHNQQGEEKDEVETFEAHKVQNVIRENNVFGNQHSVVTHMNGNLNCSGDPVRIESRYIRHCIGQDL